MFYHVSFIVDASDFEIKAPKNKRVNRLAYTGKSDIYCLKYQICVQVATSRIVDISGPIYGKWHDINVWRWSNVSERLEPGERGIGDAGYRGAGPTLLIPFQRRNQALSARRRFWNNALSSVRLDIERIFHMIKRFRILKNQSRVSHPKHAAMFRLACQLTNLELELHPLRSAPAATLLDCPLEFILQMDDNQAWTNAHLRQQDMDEADQQYVHNVRHA